MIPWHLHHVIFHYYATFDLCLICALCHNNHCHVFFKDFVPYLGIYLFVWLLIKNNPLLQLFHLTLLIVAYLLFCLLLICKKLLLFSSKYWYKCVIEFNWIDMKRCLGFGWGWTCMWWKPLPSFFLFIPFLNPLFIPLWRLVFM